jgi:hypothetical protein
MAVHILRDSSLPLYNIQFSAGNYRLQNERRAGFNATDFDYVTNCCLRGEGKEVLHLSVQRITLISQT